MLRERSAASVKVDAKGKYKGSVTLGQGAAVSDEAPLVGPLGPELPDGALAQSSVDDFDSTLAQLSEKVSLKSTDAPPAAEEG